MDADAEADGEAGRGELLQDLEVDLVGLVAAAVRGVVGQAEQAGLGEQGEELAREAAGVLLLGRPGGDLALGDVADERDEVPGLLRGQLTVHRLRGAVGHGGALLPVGRCGGARRGVSGAAGVSGRCRQADAASSRVTEAADQRLWRLSMPDRRHRVTG